MTTPRRPTTPRWLPLAFWLVATLAALIVFERGLEGGFVYDDLRLVERAPASQSIAGSIQHFFEPLYAFENPGAEVQRGLWRPLTSAALALGRSDGPLWHHVVSLGLHLVSIALLMRLCALLVRTRISTATAMRAELCAGMAGLLFAVHPSQVESVAWISAVNDPLWASLGLGALLAHERAAQRGRASILAGLLTLLALMAKEHAVVIPLLALALDLTRGARPRASALVIFGATLAAWYGLRVFVFGDIDAGLFRKAGDYALSTGREWSLRLELLGGFIENTFLPLDPRVFRPLHPVLPEDSSVMMRALLWSAGLVAALAFTLRGQRRVAAAGLLGLLVVALPFVITPVTAGRFPLSDRYLYLGVGLAAIAVVSLLGRLKSALPLVGVSLGCAAGLTVISVEHVPTFAGDVAFNIAAVEDAPNEPNVRWGASNAYFRSYARTRDVDDLMLAYIHCLHSLRAGQIYGDGSYADNQSEPLNVRMARLENLVNNTPPEERRPDPTVFWTPDDRFQATLAQVGCLALLAEVAEDADLDFALQVATQSKRVWGEAAGLNFWIGWVHKKRGDLEAAREAAAQAVAADSMHVDARGLLADVMSQLGDLKGAALLAQETLRFAPGNVPRLVQHAQLAIDAGRLSDARTSIDEAVRLSGGRSATALVARASLELARQRPGAAIEWADRALNLDPENGYAHKARGQAFVFLEDFAEATTSFGEAARLIPDDFVVHYQLGSLLLSARPAPTAEPIDLKEWRETVVPVLVRAYFLSPRGGTEQLSIQGVLEELVGADADQAFHLGMSLKTQRREALSLFWMRRAIELSEHWPEKERVQKLSFAYAELGLSYSRLDRLEDARAAFEAAASLKDDDFSIQFELGNCLLALGQPEAARVRLERALELFEGSSVRPEMREAVRSSIEQTLRQIESQNAAGPLAPPR